MEMTLLVAVFSFVGVALTSTLPPLPRLAHRSLPEAGGARGVPPDDN